MNEIRKTKGSLTGAGRRFGIAAARFNSRIGDRLVAGAVDCLESHGDRKSTRLNSSHRYISRMPSSA
jgi:6,7-dimethyl-8-ribityllumazine synthase